MYRVVVDYKLNNLNQITTKSDDGWKTNTDYSYDKCVNTLTKVYHKNSKELVAGVYEYEYDETNRMEYPVMEQMSLNCHR